MNDKKCKSIDGWDPDELWENSEKYTELLSNNSRQLAFASIAVCWTLKYPEKPDILPSLLLWVIIFIMLFFIFDMLQYVFGTIINRRLASDCEIKKQNDKTHKFILRKNTHHITYCFFWGKIFFLALAYIILIIYSAKLFFC